VAGAIALWLVLEWYGSTSEVPWLFLLGAWVFVLIATAGAYAAWKAKAQGSVDNAHMRYFIVHMHRLLDPDAGPLIAVRLHVLTRKTLGGLQTDLDSRVLGSDGQPVQGLYAAGEVAGFGGGGVHGYAALEGTFLGGCIFSGRAAGRAVAASGG